MIEKEKCKDFTSEKVSMLEMKMSQTLFGVFGEDANVNLTALINLTVKLTILMGLNKEDQLEIFSDCIDSQKESYSKFMTKMEEIKKILEKE